MADALSCLECGERVESADELEMTHKLPEVEVNDDDSISLFGNRNLFLCRNCKKPLGIARRNRKRVE